MGQRTCSEGTAGVLLEKFELMLDHHKLIDEVGFLHPSQFSEFHNDSSIPQSPSAKNMQILDETCGTNTTSLKGLQTGSVFWYGNHKLAISMQVVPVLYNAALLAYVDARRSFLSIATSEALFSGMDILKHSKALLILSPDFGSVWNSRKLVLSRKHELSLFVEELNLSMLILSYSPKSEQAWSHRRWLIKKIAEDFHDLCDIIGNESELVKTIAEKSKMNYRAWNHRCWLITYMTKWQMFNELNKSRKWSELHVADNSCFHYRRRLILNLLDDCLLKDNEGKSSGYKRRSDLLKEELDWNMRLIELYIGREALWVHRRFLSYYWIKHVTNSTDSGSFHKAPEEEIRYLDCFLGEETKLILTCLNLPPDEFDDTLAQAQHAATYMLWLSKEIILPKEYMFQEKLKEVGDLKTILLNAWPDRAPIWEGLLDQKYTGLEAPVPEPPMQMFTTPAPPSKGAPSDPVSCRSTNSPPQ